VPSEFCNLSNIGRIEENRVRRNSGCAEMLLKLIAEMKPRRAVNALPRV